MKIKTKHKTLKIKTSELEKRLAEERDFLWECTNQEQINDKYTKCTFERGRKQIKGNKPVKEIKFLEKSYYQIKHKKVPVAAILFLLLTGGIVAGMFLVKVDVYKVSLFSTGCVFAIIDLFLWIVYITTMCRKKKLLKYCVEEVEKRDRFVEQKDPNYKKEPEIVLEEPYLQGDEK